MVSDYYYLHVNSELIHKRALPGIEADFRESDLVRAYWPVDSSDRADAWSVLVEATAAGAKPERVVELSRKWGCDDADAEIYAQHVGVLLLAEENGYSALVNSAADAKAENIGRGPSALGALADLAAKLGYKPSRMCPLTFPELVRGDGRRDRQQGSGDE